MAYEGDSSYLAGECWPRSGTALMPRCPPPPPGPPPLVAPPPGLLPSPLAGAGQTPVQPQPAQVEHSFVYVCYKLKMKEMKNTMYDLYTCIMLYPRQIMKQKINFILLVKLLQTKLT